MVLYPTNVMLGRAKLTKSLLIGFAWLFLLVLPRAALGQPLPAQKVHRLALVIGNKAYPEPAEPWVELKSPVKDANDVSELLILNGYKVQKLLNASKSQMQAVTLRFLNRIDDLRADIIERRAWKEESIAVIFYFSGHGFSQGGRLHLAAIGARGKYVDDLVSGSLVLNSVTDRLFTDDDQVGLLSFVFLDACRSTVFLPARTAATSKGEALNGALFRLASGSGGAVLFSSSDGQPSIDGRNETENSIFTQAFLHASRTIDDSIGIWGFLNAVALETRRISVAQGYRPPQRAEIRGTALTEVRFKGFAADGGTIDVAQPLQIQSTAEAKGQVVALAQSAVFPTNSGSTVNGKLLQSKERGWVWLGNYTGGNLRDGGWTKVKFKPVEGFNAPLPSSIKPGTKLIATTGLYMREYFPSASRCQGKIPSSGNYAACTREVGLLSYGNMFETVGPPRAEKLPGKDYEQYWVEVRRIVSP